MVSICPINTGVKLLVSVYHVVMALAGGIDELPLAVITPPRENSQGALCFTRLPVCPSVQANILGLGARVGIREQQIMISK